MTIIDLKPVRRCEHCNHLIPASMADCPYCSQRAFTRNTPTETEEEPAFEIKPLSPKAKKGILYGCIAVVAVVAIIFIVKGIVGMISKNEPASDEIETEIVFDDVDEFMQDDSEQNQQQVTEEAYPAEPSNQLEAYQYLFNRLKDKEITEEDIEGLSKQDLRILRNWYYAQYGYMFRTDDMREFFEQMPWYEGRYTDVSGMLTDLERRNVEFIKRHE